jgi:regulation of enolase protein 1 (concanavalin A-like superfamily)
MLAEVTIKAGLCPDWPSNITIVGPQDGLHIASPLLSNEKDLSLIPDVDVMPTLDMMSDVANVIVSQHMTAQWQKEGNLNGYVTGMLTLAYHATWSTLPLHLNRHNETIAITTMDPVVRASAKRSRTYIWLARNATLTIAAVLIGIAQCFSSTKVVRNATLAALTLDVSEVTHETDN